MSDVRIRDYGSYAMWSLVFVVPRLSGYIVVRALTELAQRDRDSGQFEACLLFDAVIAPRGD